VLFNNDTIEFKNSIYNEDIKKINYNDIKSNFITVNNIYGTC
jgi:hypothetical protein